MTRTDTLRHLPLHRLTWKRPHFARYEWLVMRLGLAWLVWLTVRHPPNLTEQPAPIGLAHYVDLTWIGQAPAFDGLVRFIPLWVQDALIWIGHPPITSSWSVIALAMVIFYALGWLPLLSTGVLLAMHVFIGTLVNSQGAIHHTTQIIGYLLLGQFLCHLWHAFKPDPRIWDPRHSWQQVKHHAWNPLAWLGQTAAPGTRANDWVWFSLQMTAAAYVVSGVSKLLRSGFDWVRDIPNIPLQFEKNHLMWYYNTLEEPTRATSDFAVQVTIDYPQLAQTFFSIGLILELTAFLILWRRSLALLWGLGLFMLHTFVTELMNLQFFFNKTALILLAVNLPFWLVAIALHCRRQSPPAPHANDPTTSAITPAPSAAGPHPPGHPPATPAPPVADSQP